jgi:hypothetical protein
MSVFTSLTVARHLSSGTYFADQFVTIGSALVRVVFRDPSFIRASDKETRCSAWPYCGVRMRPTSDK